MSWKKTIEAMRGQMIDLSAANDDYNVDEEIGYSITAFQNNWKLQKAELPAIEHLMRQMASVGLTINPIHQFAFIQDQGVKIKEKEDNKPAEWAQRPVLNIEYKGLIELLTSSGAANWIRPDVVRQGDDIGYRGPYEKPEVKISNPFDRDRVDVIGAYAVAQLPDGQHFCEIMRAEELEEVKKASSGGGPWNNEFKTEMYKKSVIKRLYKTIPKNPKNRARLDTAFDISNKSDGFDFDQTSEPTEPEIDIIPLVKAITDGKGFDIIDIMDGLDVEQQKTIWNSFAPNEIHKSKEKARNLMSGAFKVISDTVADLDKAMAANDTHGAMELLSETDIKYIKRKASSELIEWLESIEEVAA